MMEPGTTIPLAVIGGLLAIGCNVLIAFQFNRIAHRKGYRNDTYFWQCFFFGLAGWLMVVALPLESDAEEDDEPEIEEETDDKNVSFAVKDVKTKICPYCKQPNAVGNTHCAKCDAPFADAEPPAE